MHRYGSVFRFLLSFDRNLVGSKWHKLSTLAFSEGGLGLRSAFRSRQSAYWVSWADCLKLMHERHSTFTDRFVHDLDSSMHGNSVVTDLRNCSIELTNSGAEVPAWNILRTGVQPEHDFDGNQEPGIF